MINPEDRFWSEGQNYHGPSENPTTQTYCNVWDWDQLRMIKVKGTANRRRRATSGKQRLYDGRDDVTSVAFTLYQLITNDTSFSDIPHWDRNIKMVQSIPEWTSHRELDSEVSKIRSFLSEWIATRRSDGDGDMERYLNAPR
ncbi:unnamed protein product [Penicillium salamii]|nr:unnamed protein product [Penicillium salamii]CAG8271702.1 unnamed protein product [Penicillium salamii]